MSLLPAQRTSTSIQIATLLALGVLPVLLMFRLMIAYSLPLPLWDEWATPGSTFVSFYNGTLTLRELFAQHNESRKFFPRLLYLALAQLGGWDVRNLMLLTFASVCAMLALFYRLLRITPGATTQSALVAWIAASFLCFSPAQLENFLYGIQIETFFPGLAVIAISVINLSRLRLVWKAVLNGVLALIATYTAAHGMLLWPLGVPLLSADEPWRKRRVALPYAGYFLCATVAVGGYFIGYNRPSHHPQFFPSGKGLGDFARYLNLWLGSYFNSPIAPPAIVGGTAILIFAAALLGAALLVRQRGHWRTFYSSGIIAAYAALTDCITAAGRIGFGVEQALDRRYRTFSLFFYLALVALLYALYCAYFRDAASARRRIFLASCSLVAFSALVGWASSYHFEAKHSETMFRRNLTLRRALEWMEVIPDNPDLLQIFPGRDYLLERARVVRDHGLLRLDWVKEEIARQARTSPPASHGENPFCRFESCIFDSNHNLWITGLAWLTDRQRRADCVVIGSIDSSGTFKPVSVMETGVEREGLKGSKRKAGFARTFSPANLPPGDVTIAAWAVDLKNLELHPVGDAKFIPAISR